MTFQISLIPEAAGTGNKKPGFCDCGSKGSHNTETSGARLKLRHILTLGFV